MSLITCPPQDPAYPSNLNYYLTYQAEVDAFPLLGCDHITGRLVVGGFGSDIMDLSPLDGIKKVDKDVQLGYFSEFYTGLVNIFDGLEEVGWGITWKNWDVNIVSIDGFHNLVRTVDDSISFDNFQALQSVTGFEKLEECGANWGSLRFDANPNLYIIPDFCSLHTIGSSLFILGSSLTSITGFRALKNIAYSFDVEWNKLLNVDSVCGFADYYAANGGVHPPVSPPIDGTVSNKICMDDLLSDPICDSGTNITAADIMANPCGFTPLSCASPATPPPSTAPTKSPSLPPTAAPSAPPSSAPTDPPTPAPTNPPSNPPTTFCSTFTAAKDCKKPCSWNGQTKICSE